MGDMTDVPVPFTMQNKSAVTHEVVFLAQIFSSLNLLNIMVANIMNVSITTPRKEKIWNSLGSEFGKEGKKDIVVSTL